MRSPQYNLIAIRLLVIAAALLAFHFTANAANLTVTVNRVGVGGKGTQPLSNANVCVSSSAGVLSNNTNSQGTVVFPNAPQGQLTVTASTSGFTGQSIQFSMGNIDKTESFILQAGSGGPVCNVTPPPPLTVTSLAFFPAVVAGGTAAPGTVKISNQAQPGGVVVNLSSSNTSVATVPANVSISSGLISQTFSVSTSQVSAATSVTITASFGGSSKTATLTVNPPPPPTTASLRVLVGTTSTVIPGSAVCITPAVGASRSAFTDSGGQAVFDGVAVGQVTITVSSSGFTGQSHNSALPSEGGTARFIMTQGSGGPVCAASAPPPPTTPPTLAITSFDWHINRRTPLFFEIALAFAASRTPGGPVVPTHYRVGESSDLSSNPWIPFQGGVPLFQMGYRGNSLTAYGQRTLFLQVKQGDLTSDVASKAVNLQTLHTSAFRLEGTELSSMISLAGQAGFPLRTRIVSVTQSACSSIDFDPNTLSFGIPTGVLSDQAWVKVVEANLLELSTKRFTVGWRVTGIEIDKSPDAPDAPGQQEITGAPDGDGFRTTITLRAAAHPGSDPTFCLSNSFRLRAIVLEGPGDDLALDQTKRWKNMFPSN